MMSPMRKVLLAGIAALFLATGTAHAQQIEGYARCGNHIVGTGNGPESENEKEFSELWAFVRWKKLPRKFTLQYDRKTNKLTLNGKRCVWID
jgi:hypothetical protein